MRLQAHLGDTGDNWFTRTFTSVSDEYAKIAAKRTADRAERRAREKQLKADLALRYPVASSFPGLGQNWQTYAIAGGVVLALLAFAPRGRYR
jgi:hypothetical protein